ncbi:endonuclease/exonuclease/phosphatase family protein [Cognatishimia activa]|uniref:Endonuclease/Exonuclease/phosphatase family protein n=1 Tax=Cognatishimia activa TaxID=1715691 RepID=A0A0P1IWD9_9RHOB|nr:endonuclease/exonuclease/phosphatase family protein [Cognatishimia activa]CUI89148.1 Endonuclease/Exonuclease/phosphatase family protein [Cognatishimia activa]CUK25661.1 Endonuclease/Exonuclease/phosphatase family protein [Cognatishimia activa]
MKVKVLSWNVEHFTGKKSGARKDRLKRVIDVIKQEDPDVFGLIEVESDDVEDAFKDAFPNHSQFVTRGDNSQQILTSVRPGLGNLTIQKDQFKKNNPYLRPAAWLNLHDGTGKDDLYFLFSHFKSSSTPEGFGLRDAMFDHVKKLKKKYDEKHETEGGCKMVLLGDLNFMGMNLTYSDKDFVNYEEIERFDKILGRQGLDRKTMTLPQVIPSKYEDHYTDEADELNIPYVPRPMTYNGGSDSSYVPALLDAVYATDNLTFTPTGGEDVRVGGWAEEASEAAQDDWIERFSDHAPLIFEVSTT